MVKRIHVVAAVVRDHNNKILIAKRPAHLHMGGLWEFPGGKVEASESPIEALKRELMEEVNILIESATPLIQIAHDYPDKQIYLDVWDVVHFSGTAKGLEGQEVQWISPADLHRFEFPAANQSIVTSAQLPAICLITGDAESLVAYLANIEAALAQGNQLFILRPPKITPLDINLVITALEGMAHFASAQWQWHIDWLEISKVDFITVIEKYSNFGVHFPSRKFAGQRGRYSQRLLSASCHNEIEMVIAQDEGVDFILLSPVKLTKNYAPEDVLAWSGFAHLTALAAVPVFALGGVSRSDIHSARMAGGQGVACIRDWWL